MIYLTVPGGEVPRAGLYFRTNLSKDAFFEILRSRRAEVVSLLIYVSLSQLLSKKAGFEIGVDESPDGTAVPLVNGDIFLVCAGVHYYMMEYLGHGERRGDTNRV